MQRIKPCLIFSILIFTASLIFAQDIKLISPITGTWANKQMLVIDTSEDSQACDYYYSIDGSDPETFGFAYDGPVLLDLAGKVTLKIVRINADNTVQSAVVNYSVGLNSAILRPYGGFIQSFFDTGLINYSAGSKIVLPEGLQYSIGMPPEAYFDATELSLNKNCILSRYIPVTLMDSTSHEKWRFLIRTFPQTAGIFSRRDVPFSITDWETLNFNDENLLYKIDDNYWELPKESKTLDRSVSHMISWQSLNYERGNPVEFFILPPKPQVKSKIQDDNSIVYYLEGDDSFTISVLNENNKGYEELFTQIGADVFYGDKASGVLKLGIFASSVYQGEVDAPFDINKRPPSIPSITSSVNDFYSRKSVDIKIACEDNSNSTLFVSVSEPYEVEDISNALISGDAFFKNISNNQFKKISGNTFDVKLESVNENPTYYKIRSYTTNGELKSFVSEYSVIVDQYNYYYDSKSSLTLADGSVIHPFATFAQCLESINKTKYAKLNIKGQLVIPEGKNQLLCNADFIKDQNGEIVFLPGASLELSGVSLNISGTDIINKASPKFQNTIPLFKVQSGVLTLENCIVSTNFSKNASFADCYNSVLNLKSSVISSIGTLYSSCISAVNSKINVKDSTLTASADTCVILTGSNSDFVIENNSLQVFGKMGRIAELFNGTADFNKNQFKALLERNSVTVNPIYTNGKTVLKETGNDNTGF